jgi:hypothetical protein
MDNEQIVTDNELPLVDEPSIGYNILGFLIPVIGFTIFYNIYEENPVKAKSLGMAALAGAWLSAFISFVVFLAAR